MDTEDDPFASATVTREDEGVGKLNEKHPVATLRVFGSNYGPQWIMYGGHNGGTQDESENCRWFTMYFQGVLSIGGKEVFGDWKMTVTGDHLEYAAYCVSKHTVSSLKPGSTTNNHQASSVSGISFVDYKPAPMRSDD